MAPKKVLVLGHPLAAEENSLAFRNTEAISYTLCRPKTWQSRSLGLTYCAPATLNSPLIVLPVVNSGRNSLYTWRSLKSLLWQSKFQLVYCWAEPWSLAAFQCAHLCVKGQLPFIFYSAENRPKSLPFPFTLTQSYCYSKARGAIAITPEVTKRLQQSGFRKPIHEIPLWIRNIPFQPAVAMDKCLIYVGRLIKLKRVDLILKALALLDGYRLKIIGDGPDRGALEGLAGLLKLGGRVSFQGVVANRSLPDQFKNCSLAVIPTHENPRQAEQFGKAAVEAAASGLPVLASRTGNYIALSREIATIHTGDFSSPGELAMKIRHIHTHYPENAVQCVSREKILQRYSSTAVATLFENAFLLQ